MWSSTVLKSSVKENNAFKLSTMHIYLHLAIKPSVYSCTVETNCG